MGSATQHDHDEDEDDNLRVDTDNFPSEWRTWTHRKEAHPSGIVPGLAPQHVGHSNIWLSLNVQAAKCCKHLDLNLLVSHIGFHCVPSFLHCNFPL